jgi:hypothetical protein
VVAVFQFIQDEVRHVGAADGVADAEGQGRTGSQPPGTRPVGQPGRADDRPVQVAGGDQCFLAFLVGELGPEPQRHEEPLEHEPRMSLAVADPVAGDPDQPAHPGRFHGGDDVRGGRVEVAAMR